MSSKELRKSFSPSYFSLDDIIASQTRVPCMTKVDIKNFGFLDPSGDSKDLASGTRTELPIWAANAMSSHKRSFITVKLPKYYNEKYRDALKADPKVVDLNRMGPQFYQAGLQLCSMPNEDAENVSEMLPELLQRRVIAMSDAYSLHRDFKSTDDATSTDIGNTLRFHFMDPVEAKLFNDSKEASEALDDWLRK